MATILTIICCFTGNFLRCSTSPFLISDLWKKPSRGSRLLNLTLPFNIRSRKCYTMVFDLYRLTATEVLREIKDNGLSVEEYAHSLLSRIEARDVAVQAWAYLDPAYVLAQAKALDAIAPAQRGPLHGVAIAIKDVIFTKG